MVIVTAKLSKPKRIAIICIAAFLLLTIIFLANRDTPASSDSRAALGASVKLDTPEARLEFLSSLGYQAEPEPVRTQEVLIPKEFTEVYDRYNTLQKNQGLDLEKYKNKKVMQYVYALPAPENGDSPGQITLLTYKNKLIAADISKSGPDGFMRELLSA